MKEKEFNLSEKIEVVGFHKDVIFRDNKNNKKVISAIKGEAGLKVKDVKEFIKRLKEVFCEGHSGRKWDGYNINYVIDKLAGDKLTK